MTGNDIEAPAPVHFEATLKTFNIAPNFSRKLMDSPPDTARTIIRQLPGHEAIMEAYELYMAESGRIIYKLARKT